MAFNYTAVCEIFQSKPALYYQDSDYYIDKIGTFLTREFRISIGNIGHSTAGEVTMPQNVHLSQPLKIGDIVQVTLLNYKFDIRFSHATPIVDHDAAPVDIADISTKRAFVISAMDGSRLVLKDYVEYNHSYTDIGYVGNVNNEYLSKLLSVITRREDRAFASRYYSYQSNVIGTPIELPFIITNGSVDTLTSYSDDFEKTNSTPYDVIIQALRHLHKATTTDSDVAIVLAANVVSDSKGYYVAPYITDVGTYSRISLRIKPGIDISTTPLENTHATKVWIQPDENADDYIFTNIAIRNNVDTDNKVDLRKLYSITDVSEEYYTNYGITSIPSLLVGYSDLIKNIAGKPPEPKFDEDGNEIEQSLPSAEEKEALAEKTIGTPLTKLKMIRLLSLAIFFSQDPNGSEFNRMLNKSVIRAINKLDDEENVGDHTLGDDEEKIESYKLAFSEVAETLADLIINSTDSAYTPVTITLTENDFYHYGKTVLDITDAITLWYTDRFGGAFAGINARVTMVTYSPSGVEYTIVSTPYSPRAISDVIDDYEGA